MEDNIETPLEQTNSFVERYEKLLGISLRATNSINDSLPVDTNALLGGLKIDEYINDGFKKVCGINNAESTSTRWIYENIDESLMFSDHRSWIYMITVDDYIVKIGETSQPLGRRKSSKQVQPNTGSKSRFGRYINGDTTDQRIRSKADLFLKSGHEICFWAKPCAILKEVTLIAGDTTTTHASTQKAQELQYIRDYENKVGVIPIWNESRK